MKIRDAHPKVLRLKQNVLGRDFIVGDIHGAYDMVVAAMRRVKFDYQTDRLLSVGDLIDRGQGSARVSKFLDQPYVFAVSGNHDVDFCQIDPETIAHLADANWNGLSWAKTLSKEEILDIQAKLIRLPVVIEVETARGTVGLVHGDVPKGMNWADFIAKIEAGDPKITEHALCSRQRICSKDESGVEGVGRVFVGHTIQWTGPKKFGNVYAVDTGAVFAEISSRDLDAVPRGFLTMANICAKTASLVRLADVDDHSNRIMLADDSDNRQFSGLTARQRG